MDNITVLLKDSGKDLYVKGEDIYYIESEHNNLVFVTKNGILNNKGTLKSILESLDKLNSPFCYIHRSYIVNLAHIKRRDENDLIMPNGKKVPISKYKLWQFEQEYARYWNMESTIIDIKTGMLIKASPFIP
ncbi:MAG: LytTR family transcriptional regulator [Lachnospiraceae bacterium]